MIETKSFSRCSKVKRAATLSSGKTILSLREGDVLSLMLFRSQILSFAQLGALIYFCCKLMNF